MTRKQRRLVLIGSGLGVLAVAVALMLNAFRDFIVFFNSPSDVVEKHVEPGTRIRLGGLVKTGSLVRGNNLTGPLRSHRRQERDCRILSGRLA